MREVPLILLEAPADLSDEAVHSMLEFLHNFVLAFENHYLPQLRRHSKRLENQAIEQEDSWMSSGEDPF